MSGINGKASELIIVGLTRAKLCELLAKESKLPDQEAYFVVGLFSILDALLSLPLEEILEGLPLEEEVKIALLKREGILGEALKCSLACEQWIGGEINFQALDVASIYSLYLKAMTWSRQAAAGLGGG